MTVRCYFANVKVIEHPSCHRRGAASDSGTMVAEWTRFFATFYAAEQQIHRLQECAHSSIKFFLQSQAEGFVIQYRCLRWLAI